MLNDNDYKNSFRLWEYLQLGQEPIRSDVGIALGGHDLGVARYAADLYRRGLFPLLVFTGGSSPTTAPLYPEGEAVAFSNLAIAQGVPAEAILIEPAARNTGENIQLTRALLATHGHDVRSVLFISMPSMQRRAYATCLKQWPEVSVTCASAPLPFDDYIASIGDERRVVENLVGDMQRIIEYPKLGFQAPQDVPADVMDAFNALVAAGYTGRLM